MKHYVSYTQKKQITVRMAGAKRPVSCGEMFMKFNILLPASEYSLCIIICCRQLEKTLQFKHTQTHIQIYIKLELKDKDMTFTCQVLTSQ